MSDTPSATSAILETVSAVKDVSPVIMGCVTTALVIWAIYRARSAHFLLDKIWRLIGGGATHDEDLKKAWLTIRDVEGFRFRTGIKFSTKATLDKTLKWLEQHDKSLSDLSFAKAWIKDKPWNFNEPKLLPIRCFTLLVFLAVAPLTMGMLAIYPETSALLTIRDSGTTFWTDGNKAQNFSLSIGTPSFTADAATCAAGPIKNLTAKDSKIVCSSLEPKTLQFIQNALKEQKVFSVYIFVLCLIAMILAIRYAARAKMAHTFFKLLDAEPLDASTVPSAD
jgi:CDP-diglyceride synthetase